MSMMGATEIQMTRRLILAAEEMVARQRGIVERLPATGELAEIGRAYLTELEEDLAERRAYLAHLLDMPCPAPASSPDLSLGEAKSI